MNNILIIDDDPKVRELLDSARCIAKHGINRVEKNKDLLKFASTCEEGIAKFIEYRPNFVFLDMMIPSKCNMSGSDIFNKIKKIDPDVIVFLMTGHSDEKEIANLIKLGIDGYIAKQGNYAGMAVSIIISVIKTMGKDD